jgi:hypothetical protein
MQSELIVGRILFQHLHWESEENENPLWTSSLGTRIYSGPFEYQARVLTTQLWHLLEFVHVDHIVSIFPSCVLVLVWSRCGTAYADISICRQILVTQNNAQCRQHLLFIHGKHDYFLNKNVKHIYHICCFSVSMNISKFVGTLTVPIYRQWFISYHKFEQMYECNHCESPKHYHAEWQTRLEMTDIVL